MWVLGRNVMNGPAWTMHFKWIQGLSVSHVQLFETACTACSTWGFPILHHSPEFLKLMSIESVMPSNHLILCRPFSSCLQSFPASGSFPVSQLFISGGQSIGASASALVLPMNVQGWFPLGLTGLISLQSHPYMTTGKNCSFDYMDLYRQSNVSVL